MSRYNPTKKRAGLVEVNEYARGWYPGSTICIGKIWVKKGTVPPVRDLEEEKLH